MNKESKEILDKVLKDLEAQRPHNDIGLFDTYIHLIMNEVEDMPKTLRLYGLEGHEVYNATKNAYELLKEMHDYIAMFRNEKAVEHTRGMW